MTSAKPIGVYGFEFDNVEELKLETDYYVGQTLDAVAQPFVHLYQIVEHERRHA